MIDEKKLIKELKEYIDKYKEIDAQGMHSLKWCAMIEALNLVECQPKVGEWIPCSERLPEEHEEQKPIIDPVTLAEIDVRYYTASDLVQVTVEGGTGRRFVCNDCTVNGRWSNFKEDLGFEVLAWQPLPEPWEGEEK